MATPQLDSSSAITDQRKADHIRINLEEDVSFDRLTTGFEDYYFMHQALPELDLDRIDTESQLFGRTLKTPLLISSMTGGTERATTINRVLAEAAQAAGMASSWSSGQRARALMMVSVCWPAARRRAPAKAIMAPLSVQNSRRG